MDTLCAYSSCSSDSSFRSGVSEASDISDGDSYTTLESEDPWSDRTAITADTATSPGDDRAPRRSTVTPPRRETILQAIRKGRWTHDEDARLEHAPRSGIHSSRLTELAGHVGTRTVYQIQTRLQSREFTTLISSLPTPSQTPSAIRRWTETEVDQLASSIRYNLADARVLGKSAQAVRQKLDQLIGLNRVTQIDGCYVIRSA